MISRKREIIIFLCILVLFVGLRVPGLHNSYHQDEYKWVYITYQSDIAPPGNIPHPPLAEFFFIVLGPRLGADNYRFIPFIFGIIDLFLLFYFVRMVFGKRTALWSTFLYAAAYYSVLASLMVDVDGQIMPFFFLLMLISYYKLREKSFELSGRNWFYFFIFVAAAVCEFLVKLSGILPIAAFALDFAIEKGVFKDMKRLLKYALLGLGTLLVLGGLVYLSKFLFPYFSISKSLVYWKHFANSSSFLGRGWLQTFIQFAKAILYTSPLLLAPALFLDKEIWRKTRVFFLFVGVAIIFYCFLFDFSLGALDRYFQFLVLPSCVVSAAVFAKYLGEGVSERKNKTFLIILAAIIVFSLQFLPHFIPSLYPKTEWLSRMLSLKWNFLFPFTGGSGPLPFYVSFLFIAVTWLVCLLAFFSSLKRPQMIKQALICVLVFGLAYNAVFVEEYLFGRINGDTEKLVKDSVAYIAGNKNIKEVMVYNDNGAFQIQRKTDKYFRRIYATPAFENTYKPIFDAYKGNILYIDIPKIAEDSMYKKFFNSCAIIYSESSKQITSTIYDCRKK